MLDLPPNKKPSTATVESFHTIFTRPLPLLDLRSPSEFAKGAFPNAINVPLMTDAQRAEVGTCYKQQGQQAAIELGHRLVSGTHRQQLIDQWTAFVQQHPAGYLYCFRGGLRSQTVQRWLSEAGIDVAIIEGGYKALRRYLIEQLHNHIQRIEWYVIGGMTGSAKTAFIKGFSHHIDLEGLANHRGSSFGRRATEQPTVIDFENRIAIEMLKLGTEVSKAVIEDEGVVIGRCSMPLALRQEMLQAPLVILKKSFDFRVETILKDYVIGLSEEYRAVYGAEGEQRYQQYMLGALQRIKKRLGGQRYQEIGVLMEMALRKHDLTLHRNWIQRLLNEYYDPMYQYQIKNKGARIVFEGDERELTAFLKDKGLEVV